MQKRKDHLTCKSNLRRETMKRATIFLLAICIGVFSLTGCGISSHKKHEQGSVICRRTDKWRVCCTGSNISKTLSSWASDSESKDLRISLSFAVHSVPRSFDYAALRSGWQGFLLFAAARQTPLFQFAPSSGYSRSVLLRNTNRATVIYRHVRNSRRPRDLISWSP